MWQSSFLHRQSDKIQSEEKLTKIKTVEIRFFSYLYLNKWLEMLSRSKKTGFLAQKIAKGHISLIVQQVFNATIQRHVAQLLHLKSIGKRFRVDLQPFCDVHSLVGLHKEIACWQPTKMHFWVTQKRRRQTYDGIASGIGIDFVAIARHQIEALLVNTSSHDLPPQGPWGPDIGFEQNVGQGSQPS